MRSFCAGVLAGLVFMCSVIAWASCMAPTLPSRPTTCPIDQEVC